MVSTRNTSRSNANSPRMQDPPGDADSRPPGTVEAMQANTNEVEALRLVNQRLIEELEQLTRQMRRPQEARQTQKGLDLPPHEGQHNIGPPRGAETEAESSQAWGHGPHLAPGGEDNEATLGACREQGTTSPSARSGRAIMGVKVQKPPTRAQPCERSRKRTRP